MTMRELAKYADLVTPKTWERLRKYGRPYKVGSVETPKDLYGISFGELIQAEKCARDNDIKGLCTLLLGIEEDAYDKASAGEVMAFAYWASSQLEYIAGLFSSIKSKPTPQQKKAGIEKLRFGLFGTLDWFCLRMGITDHAEAERVPWVRFYECMKNDNERAMYEQRLRNIYEKESRQRNHKR